MRTMNMPCHKIYFPHFCNCLNVMCHRHLMHIFVLKCVQRTENRRTIKCECAWSVRDKGIQLNWKEVSLVVSTRYSVILLSSELAKLYPLNMILLMRFRFSEIVLCVSVTQRTVIRADYIHTCGSISSCFIRTPYGRIKCLCVVCRVCVCAFRCSFEQGNLFMRIFYYSVGA